MFILELICKDYEGTWPTAICTSASREKLEEKIITERQKRIDDKTMQRNSEYLFKIGELETYFLGKLQDIQGENGVYSYQGTQMPYYSIKEFIAQQGKDFCLSIGLDEDALEKAFKRDFRESMTFRIREIEEI